jgi:hypothetical protein
MTIPSRRTAIRHAPHVVWTTHHGETVLLDTKREKYHVLNAVATSVWERLASDTTIDALVQGISEEYALPEGTDRKNVASDVERLLATLDADGLIVRSVDDVDHGDVANWSESVDRSRVHAFAPIEEWTLSARWGAVFAYSVLILMTKTALRVIGLDKTARWISRTRPVLSCPPTIDPRTLAVLEYTVAMAAALYPGRAECLERSIVLFYLLRRRGVPVSMRIGVHPDPFVAHAWVTCHGTPLNEVDEHLEHYNVVREFT